MSRQPDTQLDQRYSSPTADATDWARAVDVLRDAEIFWLTTVRPDGRPHVTPLIAVWLDGALHFGTGQEERKWRNIAANPHCVLTTGCNRLREGLDVVVEGRAERVRDESALRRIAGAYEVKYGEEWRFVVRDEGLVSAAGGSTEPAHAFRVEPTTAYGYGREPEYSHTRWAF